MLERKLSLVVVDDLATWNVHWIYGMDSVSLHTRVRVLVYASW
jgi:hypothetical protein